MTSKYSPRVVALTLVAALFGLSLTAAHAADEKVVEKGAAPKIQMAILLDTSGSMRGLINQARTQLWKVVNEFATASRDGVRPTLHVALYEYGHNSLGAENGYMRQVVPLTDDLDKVSEELFKLVTGGSKEYCGQVIDLAAKELKWSESSKDLKCIFIAGNEPFTQGPVDYREACHTAANKGVTVSTIYCGPHDEGVRSGWLDGSKLADGSFMSIDQDQTVQHIPAPQDKEITELNSKLNATYIAYGSADKRKEAKERQLAQDANAAAAGQGAAQGRFAAKASALYRNTAWDLCDAVCLGKLKIEDLKEDELPEELKKLSVEERKTFVDKKIKEREEIQAKIKELSESRSKYVADELKKLAADGKNTLDEAVISAVRTQAERVDLKFDK